MMSRHFFQPQRYKDALRSVNFTLENVANRIRNFETPERIKGTFLENWGKYWKNLYLDYKDVVIDVSKNCKARPIRASIYTTILASSFYFGKHNPDECLFREQLIQNGLKLMQVGEPIRNPTSVHDLKWLEQCYDQGVIRHLSLGIISFIWIDNYDEALKLYRATCPYLKPRYITFYQRIVDIGFLDKWWLLEHKMKDYDINETEFNNVSM